MWLLLCGLVFAGGKYNDVNSDVVVERDLPQSQEELFALFSDFPAMSKVFPADCVEQWGFGVPSKGMGATTIMTYHMGPMKRRLTAKVIKANEHYHVEWDHEGKKGFVTQFVLSEGAGGKTHVKLGTYVAMPPWPFKPVYFKKVKPAWEDCYDRALISLEKAG